MANRKIEFGNSSVYKTEWVVSVFGECNVGLMMTITRSAADQTDCTEGKSLIELRPIRQTLDPFWLQQRSSLWRSECSEQLVPNAVPCHRRIR